MTDEEKYNQLLKAYFTCFTDTESGRLVLADLLNRFTKRTFIDKPINPYDIVADEGGRSVVLYIQSKIEEFELVNGIKGH